MNLLIVDDEYYIVQGIVKAIRREELGIDQIFSAYSMEQARKIIERESVQLLLTDIEMPQENGLSLIRWIQENGYHIVSLILTGHQRFDYAQKAVMMHCFSYILKPVDGQELETQLRLAIASIREQPGGENPQPGTGEGNRQSVSLPSGQEEQDDFVRSVRRFIRENLASLDLNRNSLAEHVHMNPDYLSSLFHARFGQTLSAYITQTRIDRAKELLGSTSLSLNEISKKTGFSSSSYFHKQFKKATGLTPQQYRGREEEPD